MIISFGLVQLQNLIQVYFLTYKWSFKEVHGVVFTVFCVVVFWLLQDCLDRDFYNLFMGFLGGCDAIQLQAIIDHYFHVFDP